MILRSLLIVATPWWLMSCTYMNEWCCTLEHTPVYDNMTHVTHMCDMSDSYVCMCDMNHSYVWHMTLLVAIAKYTHEWVTLHTPVYNDMTHVTHICDMSDSYVWYESLICVTRDNTNGCTNRCAQHDNTHHWYMGHDSFIRVRDMWDMTHSYMCVTWHVSMCENESWQYKSLHEQVCATWQYESLICDESLICVAHDNTNGCTNRCAQHDNKNHWCAWHACFICV